MAYLVGPGSADASATDALSKASRFSVDSQFNEPDQGAPRKRYWALETPDTLVQKLVEKRDAYWTYLRQSQFYDRIQRNWEYYHNLYYIHKGDRGLETKLGGIQGDRLLVAVNHFRSVIQLLISYATQNRPAWDTRAMNSDNISLRQAELGNQLLDYYMEEKRIEDLLHRAAEHALVLSAGYVRAVWDDYTGPLLDGDPETGELLYEGDIVLDTPTLFDVVHDILVRDWTKNAWQLVRSKKNKWELAEHYPEQANEILEVAKQEYAELELPDFTVVGSPDSASDQIDYWEFYHLDTPALPGGRKLCFVGDRLWLEDRDWDLPLLPTFRLLPAEYLLTPLGYTPAFDLQGPQEALNAEISTILTNHAALGPTKVWFKTGDVINLAQLEPGIKAIQSDTEPKPLNFTQTPAEFFEMAKVLKEEIELASGINSVSRGQPEASLRSGTALALIDQKALQYASPFIRSYYQLLSDLGTGILKILKAHVTSPRIISAAGKNMRAHLKTFMGDDLSKIDRVTVEAGNPLTRTTAGRAQIGEMLLQNGMIKTPEEYLTLLGTGQLQPLTESVDADLRTVAEENDSLREGGPAHALATDDHVFHIRRHKAILDSAEMRTNPAIALPVLGHIMSHIQLLFDPAAVQLSTILGYPNPIFMLPPQVLNAGGGTPPAPSGSPGGAGPQAEADQANAQAAAEGGS